MQLHFRNKIDYGLNRIIIPKIAKGINLLGFSLLKLAQGQSFGESLTGKELGMIILGGRCSVNAGAKIFNSIGERKNVFDGSAYALYIPGGNDYFFSIFNQKSFIDG